MTSPAAALEPLLTSSHRVSRNITTAEDLIAAWPLLRQKSVVSQLTDSERRLFLDLPDVEMETANISAVTSLSREQLIEKAVSNRELLTEEELKILQNRFWTPSSGKELSDFSRALSIIDDEAMDYFFAAREPADKLNEDAAFGVGIVESSRRRVAAEKERLAALATLALPDAKDWIQYLYRQNLAKWGFVWLYDAAVQKYDPAQFDNFSCRIEAVFDHMLMYNGSKDIIDRRWQKLPFNAPNNAFAPTTSPISESIDYQDGIKFRKAFQEILKDPQEYQKAKDVTSLKTPTHQYKEGISGAGFLTNTFLVIDPVCINSVMDNVRLFDNMRILAFEADFPVQGREYVKGYQGFTWVRLDQLIYNFYELRLLKADEVGMDKIWEAAQQSRHQAFVSMDPGEASSWTTSNSMIGFTRDSVLGSRWYAIRDAKQAAGN